MLKVLAGVEILTELTQTGGPSPALTWSTIHSLPSTHPLLRSFVAVHFRLRTGCQRVSSTRS